VPHTSSARVEKQRPGSVASFASSASGSGSVRSGLGWENLSWARNSMGEREREREEMTMDMGWEISPVSSPSLCFGVSVVSTNQVELDTEFVLH
jgi:hypothetical protein